MDDCCRPGLGLQSAKINIPHVLLTRAGGVSPPPYFSLNVSFGVGDRPDNVRRNRRKIKDILGIQFLVSVGQIHSDRIFPVAAISEDVEVPGYDALLTGQPGVGLLIQQADCQAILLHDPVRNCIGAIHCGWRGNTLNIIEKTVTRMGKEFGTEPISLRAVISPSLGSCCGEFIDYRTGLPGNFQKFLTGPDHFDFRAISKEQLMLAGVAEANIDIIDICTVCDQNFFSYRRAMKKGTGITGRQGSVICLTS